MENNEELIEQRAAKVRKVLMKTKDWGVNVLAVICGFAFALVVVMICGTIWNLGMGYIVILGGLAIAVVAIWSLLDTWSYNELEKARHRRYMEKMKEGN